MKIPTTAPGSAPFYHGGPPMNGMEMNPQWQGNGAMPEGGAPGNGAMYMMTQPAHMPTFVGGPPAGYYPAGMPPAVQHQQQAGGNVPLPIPVPAQDFSEYMWMENEEEFDKQVMQQLEEEALMEQCIEAMLADEREALQGGRGPGGEVMEEQISKSTLNPLAAEFVPTFGPPTTSADAPSSSTPEIDCPSPDNSTPSPLSSESDAQKSSTSPANHTPQRTISENAAPKPTAVEESKTTSEEEVKGDTKKAEVLVEVVKVTEVSAKASRTETNRPPAKPSSNAAISATRKTKADSAKKGNNESVKPSDTDSVKPAKAKENVKQNKPVHKEKAPPVKKTEVKPKEEVKTSAKVVAELADDFRNAVSVTVDLQGPPLPAPAAVSTPVEAEKPVAPSPAVPAAPAVFNYAAAARANLPPKQSAAAAVAAPAPVAANKQQEPPVTTSNSSSVSRETTPTAKNATNAKSNATNQQRGASKESNSSTASSNKGNATSSFAKMTAGGNRKAKK